MLSLLFSSSADYKTKKEKYGDPLTYISLKSVLQFLPIDKRKTLASKNSNFCEFEKRVPYLIHNAKITETICARYGFFGPRHYRLDYNLDHFNGSYSVMEQSIRIAVDQGVGSRASKGLTEMFDLPGTIIKTLHVKNYNGGALFPTNPPKQIDCLILEYGTRYIRNSGVLANLENTKIKKVEVRLQPGGENVLDHLITLNMDYLEIDSYSVSQVILFKLLRIPTKVLHIRDRSYKVGQYYVICANIRRHDIYLFDRLIFTSVIPFYLRPDINQVWNDPFFMAPTPMEEEFDFDFSVVSAIFSTTLGFFIERRTDRTGGLFDRFALFLSELD